MALIKYFLFQWALLASVAFSVPATGTQYALQAEAGGAGSRGQQQPATQRKLRGRFLHITDLHPDEYYKAHTSTEADTACHRGRGPAGAYGAETSDCDSPLALVNATLDWISANLIDSIDFVVWTGDSARHDSDEEIPRHNKDILAMNRRTADAFQDTFSDEKGLVVPVVPTFGNNDIYPHNILMPGPNDILKTYTDIWRSFIPEAQRHSFEFGGWFYTEVIPGKLAVFSLNTMYFFDRNAGIDDCVHPSEPGYKHFEWLRVQLQSMRTRGMKAILMGHVPPARTSAKQLWDETCWQKYTLWLEKFRDVVVGSLYGHMNIDHFLLQDTKEIDLAIVEGLRKKNVVSRETMDDDISIQSSTDYLKELRDDWARLPDPTILEQDVEEAGKKKHKKKKGKKGKKKLGGPWAERYQLTLISPSIVPNYFPTLRVIEYNITGLEDAPSWVDTMRALDALSNRPAPEPELHELELRQEPSFEIGKRKKKKGKKPKHPNLPIPNAPEKGAPPGPAYAPQPLTFTGFTQYYANLTYINNDITTESMENDEMSLSGWNPGKHKDKTPKHKKPQPKKFAFEVEYSTFDDKIYKLKDLTVKSFVDLAHRIGKASAKSKALVKDDPESNKEASEQELESADALEDSESEEGEDGLEHNDDDDELDSELEVERKKKHKGHKKKKKKHGKGRKTWLHFLNHAFVSTRSKQELEGMG
ncbi:Uu.00g044530.m01.CDS01 [Anthostomella pinea]|uniref:Endopolyphosphatase n=1 Tax=Anthostomella pinea TaxID=933095 RepID=A0AAI8YEB0_9PEZI|nr:Uu.00g044530.m01.CDS01 [Anthostomella pinea]